MAASSGFRERGGSGVHLLNLCRLVSLVLSMNSDFQLRIYQKPFVGRVLPKPAGDLTVLPKHPREVCRRGKGERGWQRLDGNTWVRKWEKGARELRDGMGLEGSGRTYPQFTPLNLPPWKYLLEKVKSEKNNLFHLLYSRCYRPNRLSPIH